MNGYLHPFHEGEDVSQEFGTNPESVYNPPGGHTGMDVAVFAGTPVHAAADGIIDAAQEFADYNNEWLYGPYGGNTIVLNCGEHKPSFGYSHLSRFLVRKGERVRKGQIIALSGNSGTATTGDHCHLEALPPYWNTYNGTYGRVDPRLYFTEYPSETTQEEITMAKLDDDDRLFLVGERKTIVREVRANATATVNAFVGALERSKVIPVGAVNLVELADAINDDAARRLAE